jgi:hypothetical protein
VGYFFERVLRVFGGTSLAGPPLSLARAVAIYFSNLEHYVICARRLSRITIVPDTIKPMMSVENNIS